MEKITKADANTLGTEVREAMKVIAEKHGVIFVPHGGSYDPERGTYTTKVEFNTAGKKENDKKMEAKYLKMYVGIEFGHPLRLNGEDFEVVGYNMNKPKNDLQIKRLRDGKLFQCSSQNVIKK